MKKLILFIYLILSTNLVYSASNQLSHPQYIESDPRIASFKTLYPQEGIKTEKFNGYPDDMVNKALRIGTYQDHPINDKDGYNGQIAKLVNEAFPNYSKKKYHQIH